MSKVQELTARLFQRSGLDRLPAHLEAQYGTRGAAVTRLDGGVMRADRHDGPGWVARVFPAARPIEGTEGDAAVLRVLERWPAVQPRHWRTRLRGGSVRAWPRRSRWCCDVVASKG